MKTKKLEVVRGSGNVFRDLQHENADVEQLKALLAAEIIKTLDQETLSVRGAHQRTGIAAAELVGVQANTAIRFFRGLRQLISSKLPSYELSGEVEADESYFGGVRKGRRGRGAKGKVAVFGLLKRGGKVYTAIVANAKTNKRKLYFNPKRSSSEIASIY